MLNGDRTESAGINRHRERDERALHKRRSCRVVLVDGDKNILPGIDLILVPGHTIGLQAVAVNTEKRKAVLASYCAHIARSFKEDIPSCLIMDMVARLKTYGKLRAMTSLDLIFLGHDTLMLINYPKVAEDVTRLVR